MALCSCSAGCLHIYAPVCSSWTLISMGTHQRSMVNPFGNSFTDFVQKGTCMVTRHMGDDQCLHYRSSWYFMGTGNIRHDAQGRHCDYENCPAGSCAWSSSASSPTVFRSLSSQRARGPLVPLRDIRGSSGYVILWCSPLASIKHAPANVSAHEHVL